MLGTAPACLPDPRQAQSSELFARLVTARAMFASEANTQAACDVVGEVQNRLYGEPGLVNDEQAWPNLRDAATALQAICGQSTLLAQPSSGSPAEEQARSRWREGVQRESGIACDHLRAAAAALSRTQPC